MLVYRVQDRCGCGPYAGSKAGTLGLAFQNKFKHCPFTHPVEGWDDDDIRVSHIRSSGNLRWAFASLLQLQRWFDPFAPEGYDYLRKRKYIIATFEVSSDFVWQYDAQITFDRSEATHISDEEFTCTTIISRLVTTCARAVWRLRRG